ncbi:MAG: hypothetical protein E6I88_00660 [Chloroflexi bacterium]|nr:MAG: hypothetical protein E6I88_00660 [Chloroflexota bacterium]TME47522.1 MAG: hypothetical protein E6I56_03795 [Chloroflexota bacterium]
MSRKRADGVEGVLRKADAALDDWFRQSRITTHQASVAFGRFLERTKRQSAGVLRDRVDGLQAGLEKLSAGLEHVERPGKRSSKAPTAAPSKAPRAASGKAPRGASGKRAVARKTKKAA